MKQREMDDYWIRESARKKDPIGYWNWVETHPLVTAKYIPLDKSWISRVGILALRDGKAQELVDILQNQDPIELGGDALSILETARTIAEGRTDFPAVEGATWVRFFNMWRHMYSLPYQLGKSKTLAAQDGTGKARAIYDAPDLATMTLDELGMLDGRTTQHISARILVAGLTEIPEKFMKERKIEDSVTAVRLWNDLSKSGKPIFLRHDDTIFRQYLAAVQLMHTGHTYWECVHREDYALGVAIGKVSDAQRREWSGALKEHESDRTTRVLDAINRYNLGEEQPTTDHRIIQMIALLGKIDNPSVSWEDLKILHPEATGKTTLELKRFFNDMPSLGHLTI